MAAVVVEMVEVEKEGGLFKKNGDGGIAREIVNKSKNGWTRGVRLIKHVHFVH